MFSGYDNKQFICSKISSLGFNIKPESIFLKLASSGDNCTDLRAEFYSTDLNYLVDKYVDDLIITNAPYLQTEPLREKLKYFLLVFAKHGYGMFLLNHSKDSVADISFFDICDFIKNRIADIYTYSGVSNGAYNELMEIDGKVLISRHALSFFYHSEFSDFIKYCREKLIELLSSVYWTFVDVKRTYSLLGQYQYSRKINDELCLSIKIYVSGLPQDIHGRYIEYSNVDGECLISRNNDAINKIFSDAATGDSVPVVLNVELTAVNGEVIYSTSLDADAAYSHKAVVKIHNRKQLLKESFSIIRCLLDDQR